MSNDGALFPADASVFSDETPDFPDLAPDTTPDTADEFEGAPPDLFEPAPGPDRGDGATDGATDGTTDRVSPISAVDYEEAVLGTALVDQDAAYELVGAVAHGAYADPVHAEVARAIAVVCDSSAPVNTTTVGRALREIGARRADIMTLSSLKLAAFGMGHDVAHYAAKINEKARLRQAESVARKYVVALADAQNPASVLDAFQSDVLSVGTGGETSMRSSLEVANDEVGRIMAGVAARKMGLDTLTGVPTGFERLDYLTTGWQGTDLTILAARPSMGKTMLMLSFALAAAKAGVKPAVFSLEMSANQLMRRLITMESRVDSQRLRHYEIDKDEQRRVKAAAATVGKLGFIIDDTASLSISRLRAKARRYVKASGAGILFVDYLQLMDTSGSSGLSRNDAVGVISRGLKLLAKELGVPVIALSQLSRAVESRGGDRRPHLPDLRDSGNIEQDADNVAFLYRPERYGIETYDKNEAISVDGLAEIILAKQRNGPLGDVIAHFSASNGAFDPITTRYDARDGAESPPPEAPGDHDDPDDVVPF